MPLNIEIKARCQDPLRIRQILEKEGAEYKGEDHQIDTYFRVPNGRLKLREGTIERALIHYQRSDQAGPKRSDVLLYRSSANDELKAVLTAAMGIKVIVDKHRHIYFINNVKFHVDEVKDLGSFVEIEAIGEPELHNSATLRSQCEKYRRLLAIKPADLLEGSYSDLLLASSSL